MTVTAITDHGLPALQLENALGEAVVHLLGAHVVHFQPRGQRPVLWLSAFSRFAEGSAIRGGIPLCAPWFGPHATDPAQPAHGLLRQRRWTQIGTSELADGRTTVVLSLIADPQMHAAWPYAFEATLTVTVGATLTLELAIRNCGNAPFLLSEALHTYLNLADVRHVTLNGLGGATYLDKVDGGVRKVQASGPMMVTGQTDRVYLTATDVVVIDDPGFARRITLTKSGSGATVIWNPWSEKAKAMTDFGADAWPNMLCVEAANAADSTVVVPPAFTHHLSQTIAVAGN